MQRKTRIAFFVDILQKHFDGVSNTVHQLAARLPSEKFEILFITALGSEEFPYPIHVTPYFTFPLYKDYRVGKTKGIKQVLEDFRPDLIHYSSPSLFGRFAIKYAKSKNIPVTTIYHTHFYSYMEYYFGFFPPLEALMGALAKKLTQWFYQNTTMTFVPSTPMKDFLISIGVKEKSVSFFRRGINRDHFNPSFKDENWKKDLGIEGRKVVLFVSRLVKEKELDTIIRVYRLFSERRQDVAFVITGDGPFKGYMEKRMPEAIFTGKQTKEELAKIYASSDVFIFPSITETFGNVVLEALASGLPAVVAQAGGPQGIVERSNGGFVVPPKSEEGFFERINLLLDDQKVYEEKSNNAIAYASTQNWEDICAAMAKELIEIASEKHEIKE